MIVVILICAALLAAAAVMAIIRIERGPSMLDRTVALDVFTTTLVATIALEAAVARRTDTVPILVIVSMVGFISSVTVARFAAQDPPSGEERSDDAPAGPEPVDADARQVEAGPEPVEADARQVEAGPEPTEGGER